MTLDRNTLPSFLIVDAQSVKNSDTAGSKGHDAGKKVSGIKRHLAGDTQGFPHAVAVTTADVTDRKGAAAAFERCAEGLQTVKSVLADGGHTDEEFADELLSALGATVLIAKRNELHKFKVMPQRWIVERCFAWLEKCRRSWKNREQKLNTSLQFMYLAFLVQILKIS
jgi:transposase